MTGHSGSGSSGILGSELAVSVCLRVPFLGHAMAAVGPDYTSNEEAERSECVHLVRQDDEPMHETIVLTDLDGTMTCIEGHVDIWFFIQGLPCCQRILRSIMYILILPIGILLLLWSEASVGVCYFLLFCCLPANINQASHHAAVSICDKYRSGVMAEITKLQSEGAHVAIVSGTAEPILRTLASNGGYTLIATNCEIRDGHFTGFLSSSINVGPEKSKRVLQWLKERYGPEWRSQCVLVGYGNSFNDRHFLSLCDQAVVVAPSARLRAEAQRKGWRIFGDPGAHQLAAESFEHTEHI